MVTTVGKEHERYRHLEDAQARARKAEAATRNAQEAVESLLRRKEQLTAWLATDAGRSKQDIEAAQSEWVGIDPKLAAAEARVAEAIEALQLAYRDLLAAQERYAAEAEDQRRRQLSVALVRFDKKCVEAARAAAKACAAYDALTVLSGEKQEAKGGWFPGWFVVALRQQLPPHHALSIRGPKSAKAHPSRGTVPPGRWWGADPGTAQGVRNGETVGN